MQIRRIVRPASALTRAALLVILVSTGCRRAPEPAAGGSAAPETIAARVIDPATVGVIEGIVRFGGVPPAASAVAFSPECRRLHEGEVLEQLVEVADGQLANAFVHVASGLEGYRFGAPEGDVVIDQVGCLYTPRVVGVRVGQPLVFVNSDPLLHNVHALPEVNKPANFSMPVKGSRMSRTFTKPEVMVMTKCDVHPWMRAWIGVVAHPCFAVTGEDGSFRLEGVPPGELVIEAWHETLGRVSQSVTLAPSETERIELVFPDSPG